MATTSGNLTTGTATIGGPGNTGAGGRFGLRARVTAGVVTLGCAAALAIGGLGGRDTGPTHARLAPAAPIIQANTMTTDEQRRFLEQNQLPEWSVLLAAPTDEQWQFIAATTYEQRRFLEQNELPAGSALPPVESAEFHGTGYTER